MAPLEAIVSCPLGCRDGFLAGGVKLPKPVRTLSRRCSSALSSLWASEILARAANMLSAREAMAPRLFVKVTTSAAAAMNPMAAEPIRWPMNHSRTAAEKERTERNGAEHNGADHTIDNGILALVTVAGSQRDADRS